MRNDESNKNLLWLAAFAAVGALYIAARLWNLTASCLWFDEIFGASAAAHDWAQMFGFVAQDLIHPPLFYVLLKIWIAIGGESLLWLRLFAIFWSVLAIAPFLLLCRELKIGKNASLTAFALIAANGALIRYAQEVRMYGLLFCVSLASFWLFVRFLNENVLPQKILSKNFGWLFFVNLLLVYTHYFGWLFVASEFLVVCLFKRERLKSFLIAFGLLILSFAPWLFAVWQAAHASDDSASAAIAQNVGWQAKPGFAIVAQFVLALAEPFYYPSSSLDRANFYLIAAPVALVCFAAILVNRKLQDFRLLIVLFAAPVLAAFLISRIAPFSIWGTRHLIAVFPAFGLLAAVSIRNLPGKELKLAALVLLACLVSIAGFRRFAKTPETFVWCGWRELAARAAENEPNDNTIIYAFEDDAAYYLWFALRDNPRFRVVLINGYADMPKDAAYFLPRGFDDVTVADKSEIAGKQFWLAFRDAKSPANKQVLRDLQNQNYRTGAPLEFRANGVTAFLIKVEK